MANTAFKQYASEHGGRVLILFLLFLLALYELVTAGFNAFAIICILPILVLAVLATFRDRMLIFWGLIFINYFVQWKSMPLPEGIPVSLYNEMLEILLIAMVLINPQRDNSKRICNVMFLTLVIWGSYCTLEILNDTCNLGISIPAWFNGARMMSFQLIYAFLVFTLYISNTKILIKYFYVWGALALFASFWVWKQKNMGFTALENAWLQGRGRTTHIIQGGTLIRYFSIYSDAANFGIGIASTAVAFIIFGITSKIRRHRIFFLTVGLACAWAMFPSGTRTAIACLMAGFMAYIFLSKSFKIAIPFTIIFGLFVFLLAFTNVGQGNQQIRRMRSAFNKDDASANQRTINQETMRKYMKEAPWGIGLGREYSNVPANNKFRLMSTIPPDSEYVFIWLRTGIVGITTFLILTAIMIAGGCWIVFFSLKSPSLRGIGAGLCCAMISQQLGGYGNQVLMQYPNCLVFYGGLAIVYILPFLENEWIEYEKEQLAIQEEKKRLKLEKKRASRV
ncbi:MAG: O-antigen ligase family protein [Prevotella sp.]|nr:O-antigen ligase family protein [Prevotella sp.]